MFATIRCQVEGDLTEKSNEKVLVTRNNLIKLEEKIQKDAAEGFKDFIQQTQEDGSDIFGFGEYVRATQPAYWNKEIKTKEKWESKYKEMSVDVSMHVKIRRIGTKTK